MTLIIEFDGGSAGGTLVNSGDSIFQFINLIFQFTLQLRFFDILNIVFQEWVVFPPSYGRVDGLKHIICTLPFPI